MATVILTHDARRQFDALPIVIRVRVTGIFERLAEWPDVAGAKPLRGKLKGQYRVRTGDYRVQFQVGGDTVMVNRVGHRDGFYDDQ